MEPLDLLVHAADTLSKMQVRYLVTGSMATITYGEARFTNDVDMVADLQARHIPQLLKAFPAPDFYVSEAAVIHAIERQFQFNVIHPKSGLKIDFMIPSADSFNQSRLSRGVSIELDSAGRRAQFASAEDAILMMRWPSSGGLASNVGRMLQEDVVSRKGAEAQSFSLPCTLRLGAFA